MLSFKQYLIEKTEDTKYGGMNVPLDLADFPDNDSGSVISPVNFSGSALNPVKYTRTDRDAYDAALKLKNEKILANNKKHGLSDEIDKTPFEDAFNNTRKYIESTVMDPGNKENEPRSPEDMKSSRTFSSTGTMNQPPDLGKRGWLGSILNPDNPLDSGSLHTDLLRQIKDKGTQISQVWNDFANFARSNDPFDYAFSKNYRERKKLNSPLWQAHNEAGEKEARNARLGVTPSVVNPNPPENYHDSQDYFDRITGIANTLYNANTMFVKKENQKLSPFDMISLEFGKDKTKERNDFLAKQKEYLKRSGPNDLDYSDQAKLARQYADLRDPKHDEAMLYKPLEITHFDKTGYRYFDPPEAFLGRNNVKYPELVDAKLTWNVQHLLDPYSTFNKAQRDKKTPQLPVDQSVQKLIDNQMSNAPNTFETTIDMNKDNIKDWDQYIQVMNHEGQHAIGTQLRGVAAVENAVSSNLEKKPEYKSPATIKYGIEPSTSGIALGSGYEELEKRGILDSWELTPEQKETVKTALDQMDNPTPSPDNRFKIPNNYFWSRAEMPAFMRDIKGRLLKSTGSYPTSDQTDEEIEKDRDRMYKILQQNGPGEDLAPLKALEMMRTPEGKAIYRGVEKASPKQDRRYA